MTRRTSRVLMAICGMWLVWQVILLAAFKRDMEWKHRHGELKAWCAEADKHPPSEAMAVVTALVLPVTVIAIDALIPDYEECQR